MAMTMMTTVMVEADDSDESNGSLYDDEDGYEDDKGDGK